MLRCQVGVMEFPKKFALEVQLVLHCRVVHRLLLFRVQQFPLKSNRLEFVSEKQLVLLGMAAPTLHPPQARLKILKSNLKFVLE